MTEKITICHDCHDFKYKNINIYSILTFFGGDPTFFLARWIVIAPFIWIVIIATNPFKMVASFEIRFVWMWLTMTTSIKMWTPFVNNTMSICYHKN
jgi:hypothetical protein